MGSVGINNRNSAPDEFNGALGDRQNIDSNNLLLAIRGNKVNPNYAESDDYKKNCALCATAVALKARGYDVEAMPRDTKWRGFNSVFDVDYTNTDNYILSSSKYGMTGVPQVGKYGGLSYMRKDENGKLVQVFVDNPPTMPRGAKAVSKAIEDKVKSWGDGSVAVLNVAWKHHNSAHAINVINKNGIVVAYDGQTDKLIPDLGQYLSRTIANQSTLVRVDNAPVKANIKDLDKIVKRRNKK